MSGENQLTSALMGATASATGFAVLPNTQGDGMMTMFGVILVVAGAVILTSFVILKLVARKKRLN